MSAYQIIAAIFQTIGVITVSVIVVNILIPTPFFWIFRGTKEMHQRMKALRVLSYKTSYEDVIACSLAMYEYLWKCARENRAIFVRENDGTEHPLDLQ